MNSIHSLNLQNFLPVSNSPSFQNTEIPPEANGNAPEFYTSQTLNSHPKSFYDLISRQMLRGLEENDFEAIQAALPYCTHTVFENGNSALHLAVKSNNIVAIKGMLEAGYNVHAINNDGFTPLHFAVKRPTSPVDNMAAALLLMQKGASPNALDNEGYTPVTYAWGLGNYVLFDYFLDHGGLIWKKLKDYKTVLFDAYLAGDSHALQYLISQGVNLNERDLKGITLLYVAVKDHNLKLTDQLLSLGANPNLQTSLGNTPLLVAVHQKSTKIVKLLLKYGADVNLCNLEGDSPLIYAVLQDQMVKELVEKGAAINHRNKGGFTALHYALGMEDYAIAKFLFNYGADPRLPNHAKISPFDILSNNPESEFGLKANFDQFLSKWGDLPHEIFKAIQDNKTLVSVDRATANTITLDGATPLIAASFRKQLPNVIHLIRFGAKLNAQSDQGYTALMEACRNGSRPIVEYLIFYKAELNLQNLEGDTALMVALKHSHFEIALILILREASVDIPNLKGDTALHLLAAEKEVILFDLALSKSRNINSKNLQNFSPLFITLVKNVPFNFSVLLFRGVDIHQRGGAHFGTPLHQASLTNIPSIVTILIAHGVHVNSRDALGATPLHYAIESSEASVLLLLQQGANPEIKDFYDILPIEEDGKGKIPLAKYVTKEKDFEKFAPYPQSHILISYLYLQWNQKKNPKFLRRQIRYALLILEQIKTCKCCKEPENVLLELFYSMPRLNPKLASHENYLKLVHEAIKFVTLEKDWHCLIMTMNFNEDINVCLAKIKKILPYYRASYHQFSLQDPYPIIDVVLTYIHTYRLRDGVPQIYELLRAHRSFDKKLLSLALECLIAIQLRRSPEQKKILVDLFKERLELSALILEAFWATKLDPIDDKAKTWVFYTLIQSDVTQESKLCLLKTLGHYYFSDKDQDDLKIAKWVVQQSYDTSLKLRQACANTLILIGLEDGLRRAKEIVNSSDWDEFSRIPYNPQDDGVGAFTRCYSIPPAHMHRERLNEVISEKLALAQGIGLRHYAESLYEQFLIHPGAYPSIAAFKQRIVHIRDYARFIKPMIFYPKDSIVLRGMTSRTGDIQAVIEEVFKKGSGSADLSKLTEFDCHWTRQGQIFFTHKLDYIIGANRFDDNGVLLGVSGDYLNQQLLNENGRFEKESRVLNSDVYQTVPLAAIHHIILKTAKFIPSLNVFKRLKILGGSNQGVKETIARKVHIETQKISSSYFKKEGIRIASTRRIVKETLIHYIMREYVKENPEITQPFPLGYQSELEKLSFVQLATYLQTDFLPKYRVPFSTYSKDGQSINPVLIDYALPYLSEIPRWLHGPSHASRALLWGAAEITLLRRFFQRHINDPHAILFAIFNHDRERKDDGHEFWDKKSGAVIKSALLQLGCPLDYAKMLGAGVARKQKRETLYQRIIDGADCIEILRLKRFETDFVLLFEGGEKDFGFRTWELPIFQDLCDIGMKDYATNWLKEMHHFIQLTEEPRTKIYFETQSSNLILAHLSFLQKTHESEGYFPILTDLLQDLIRAIVA